MSRDRVTIDLSHSLRSCLTAAGWLSLALLLLLTVGCGGDSPPPIVPFKGIVTLDGEPLPQAEVRFIPQLDLGSEYIASGVSDELGRFTLSSGGREGACVGQHLVTVSEADVLPELLNEQAQAELAEYRNALKNRPIPPKFADPITSGLTIEVKDGSMEWALDLVSD